VTTAETHQARSYLLGQHETRSVLGRREPGEVAVLVGSVALGVLLSLAVAGRLVGLLALVVLISAAIVSVYVPIRGRTAYRWLPVDLRWQRRQRAGDLQYRSSSREAGVDLATAAPVPVAEPSSVGNLTWLSTSCRGEPLAVVIHPDGGLTACLEIEGPGLGLADTVEQEAAAARWGTVLRDLANADTLVDRLSLIERSVPRDPRTHERYVQRFGWVPAPDRTSEDHRHMRA
jgi:hypothetical protein